jgi:hypothetical protein
MCLEEQLSYFSRRDSNLSEALRIHTATILAELSRRFERLEERNDTFRAQLDNVASIAQRTLCEVGAQVPSSNKKAIPVLSMGELDQLTVDSLCLLQGALLFDSPGAPDIGRLRTMRIWIGSPGTTSAQATYVPPDPASVPELLTKLLLEWNSEYPELKTKSNEEKVSAIARFHHAFLKIHPFADGNGRVARYLLTIQSGILLGERRRVAIEDRAPYLSALAKADDGEFAELEALITQAIYGQEFIPGSPCQMSGQPCPSCRTGTMDTSEEANGVQCNKCHLFIPA